MNRVIRLLGAFALAGVVCLGVIALLICVTQWISGRPSPFIHMLLDLGLFACAVLFGAIVIVYPLIALVAKALRWSSQRWAIVYGALVGITAFAMRYFMLREGEDPNTMSAYLAFLWGSPGEIAGLLPFALGGITFALLAQRATSRGSETVRR